MPARYSRKLRQHGSDIDLDHFETCHAAGYNCPLCGSTDRDRLYALYLGSRLSEGEERGAFRMLDIAPSRPLSRHIRKRYGIRYRTADLWMKGVDDRVDVMEMSCYPDAAFDAFLCSHVLEHVEDDRRALRELFRVLAPAGWGIVMAPISLAVDGVREAVTSSAAERWRLFGQGDHLRLYSRDGFVARLRGAGFRVDQLRPGDFTDRDPQGCGLSPISVLYVVRKPAMPRPEVDGPC